MKRFQDTKTHVANGSDMIVYACVKSFDKIELENIGVKVNLWGSFKKHAIAGVPLDTNVKIAKPPPGFVRIAPGDCIPFPSKSPKITILGQDGTFVCHNHVPQKGDGTDCSVIVTDKLTYMDTEYGKLWIGADGNNYKRLKNT